MINPYEPTSAGSPRRGDSAGKIQRFCLWASVTLITGFVICLACVACIFAFYPMLTDATSDTNKSWPLDLPPILMTMSAFFGLAGGVALGAAIGLNTSPINRPKR